MSTDRILALANHLEIPIGDVDESTYGENTFDAGGLGEFLILTDEEADTAAAEAVKESVWAFRSEFLEAHTVDGIDADVLRAIQEAKSEDANAPILALIAAGSGVDHFVQDAIGADGRGHFLAGYDNEEIELEGDLFAYRVN